MKPSERSAYNLVLPIMALTIPVSLTVARFGFVYPAGFGWREELLDYGGIVLAVVGALLSAVAFNGRRPNGACPWWKAPGYWAVAAGFAFILGQLIWGACLASISMVAVVGEFRRQLPVRGSLLATGARDSLRAALRTEGRLLALIFALCLLLEMWEDTVAPGGYVGHAGELAAYGCLLALVCVGLAASATGFEARASAAPGSALAAARIALVGGVISLVGFFAIAMAIRWDGVHRLDEWVVQSLYMSGRHGVTQLMREISNAGGRDLAVYWVPAIILGLCLARRRHMVAYFAASMLGTLGLEVLFKTLVQRPRPDFTRGVHLDSFPSGHALAATILAGTLLLIWLPACRWGWQRALVWSVVLLWPIVVGASRVYLGRHYVTDVAAGILLGAAWVQLCYALMLALPTIQASTSSDRAVSTVA